MNRRITTQRMNTLWMSVRQNLAIHLRLHTSCDVHITRAVR